MVNVLHCPESLWRGDGELCRWCNSARRTGKWKNFCGRTCAQEFYDNHVYGRGRERCYEASRGPCSCQDYQISTALHGRCAACDRCEGDLARAGDRLTCNHIEMRNGIPMGLVHCIHHISNLEMLCWGCHEALNMRGNVGRPWAEV